MLIYENRQTCIVIFITVLFIFIFFYSYIIGTSFRRKKLLFHASGRNSVTFLSF